MDLVTELLAITAALNGAGIRYAVVGGLAVTMHGAVEEISREGLVKIKQLGGREQDLADLAKLEDGDG